MLTKKQRQAVFIILFLFLLGLAIFLLWEYTSAILSGALLAYFLYPLYQKVLKRVKYKLVAQTIISVTSGILLLAVVFLLINPLIDQTDELYKKTGELVLEFQNNCQGEHLCVWLKQINIEQKVQEGIQGVIFYFVKGIGNILEKAFSFFLFLTVIVFSLFYFLDNGKDIIKSTCHLFPMEEKYKKHIFERINLTIQAVIGGSVISALAQGVIGGVLFALAGIPLAFFWGFFIAFLAFIPAIGPSLAWVPAVIFLVLKGNIITALWFGTINFVVLGYIDMFVKPKLIGDKIQLSSFVIFLGVLGGLHIFGILGLFLGPLILSLLVTFIKLYAETLPLEEKYS